MMRKMKGKASKLIAAGLAVIMALGCSGAETILASGGNKIRIDEAHFPDDNFRELLLGREYDKNGDGYFDDEEILLLRNIHCDGMGIKSLKGIEYFTELRGLNCTQNEISSIDLSNNKLLTGVWCSENKFTKLDFTPNPDLLWVYCYDCNITELNVSNNKDMAFIECNDNPLKKLDVSKNENLEHLICNSCGIKELDLGNNKKLAHLDALSNNLTTLDLSYCPKMKRLDIWDNEGLGNVDISSCKELQYYNCAYNGVTELDLSHNPELTKLNCAYNKITELDLSHNPRLAVLICEDNQIEELDISNNTELHFFQAFINGFTKLNIGDNRFLVKTYNEGVQDDVMGIATEWMIDYGGDDSTGGDSKYFFCVDDKVTVNTTPTKPAPEDPYANEGYIEGSEELITRERAVQTLYELAGKPSVKGLTSRFDDVRPGAWYYDAVVWGEANDAICVGSPDISSDIFGVGRFITRQDLMLMVRRFAEYMGFNKDIDFGRTDDFIDYFELDTYAWEGVTWAETQNIMVGPDDRELPREERRIYPHAKAKRADFEQMLRELYEVNYAGEIDPHAGIAGDANGDGKVNIQDALLIRQHLAQWNVNIILQNADVNADGKVDITDALIIRQFLASWKVMLK